jgi:hypothetical protein
MNDRIRYTWLGACFMHLFAAEFAQIEIKLSLSDQGKTANLEDLLRCKLNIANTFKSAAADPCPQFAIAQSTHNTVVGSTSPH